MTIEEIKSLVAKNPSHTIGAMLALFNLQESDEQAAGYTSHQNGVGFNGVDSGFMTSLVRQYQSRGELTHKQLAAAQRALVKYAGQLAEFGYQPVEFQEATPKEPEIKPNIASLEKGLIRIEFSYSPDLVAKIKTLNQRRYHAESKTWSTPAHPDNIEQLMAWGFRCDRELRDILKQSCIDNIPKVESIPGLKMQLYPYQMEGVSFVESRNGRAIVADEMGLGKTPQALAWLQLRQDARPAVIIVPATVKLNWKREAERWMTNPRVQVLTGSKPQKLTGQIIVTNYDIIAHREKCPVCLGKKKDKLGRSCPNCKGKGKLISLRQDLAKLAPKAVIMDECQMAKNNLADRTIALKALCKQAKHVIPLSGTPIVNRPSEFYNPISLVDPQMFPSYFKYAQRYCGATHNGFGWDFNGATNTQELHHKLTSTIMIRRLKRDVLKDLPDKQRATVPIEISKSSEYFRAEADFTGWLNGIDPDKAEAAEQAEALVKINYLKQLAATAKMDSCIEWIKDFLDSGEKLVVFLDHKAVMDKLMGVFAGQVVKIDGSVSHTNRQAAVDAFQNDENIRLFLGSKAAKEGITLTAASNTATIELWWEPGAHDQAEDRVHRIGQTADSVTAWYLIAADTIEEDIAELIDSKRAVLAQVLDGEDAKADSMLTELLRRFKEK